VSVLILQAAWRILWPALRELADTGINTAEREKLLATAAGVNGVNAVHALRTRHVGPGVQVDLHMLIDHELSVQRAHEIAETVNQRLLSECPQLVDVLIHVEPDVPTSRPRGRPEGKMSSCSAQARSDAGEGVALHSAVYKECRDPFRTRCVDASSNQHQGGRIVAKKHFTAEEAKQIGEQLGIDWSKFDVEQFRAGMDVELEHGLVDPHTNVSQDDPLVTGKIALAHLNEFPDYYTRLAKMETEAEEYWESK
jgi:hypothetical protein